MVENRKNKMYKHFRFTGDSIMTARDDIASVYCHSVYHIGIDTARLHDQEDMISESYAVADAVLALESVANHFRAVLLPPPSAGEHSVFINAVGGDHCRTSVEKHLRRRKRDRQ